MLRLSPVTMQKRSKGGRWKSESPTYYLRNDDRALATVGRGVIGSTGLLEQLQRQSDRDIIKRAEKGNGRAGGGAAHAHKGEEQNRSKQGEKEDGDSHVPDEDTFHVVIARMPIE